MSRRSLGALALALLLGITAGCDSGDGQARGGRQSATTTTTKIANRNVLVMGDSNVFRSSAEIDHALRDAGFEPTEHGLPGYGLKDTDAYWLPKLPALLADDPAVVVVALGTNDTASEAEVQGVAGGIDKIMFAIGGRRVIWITHVDVRPFSVPDGGRTVNGIIRAATASWPNLTILDFTFTLAAHPEFLRDDHLHFTPEGMRAYASSIATAVETAARRAAR